MVRMGANFLCSQIRVLQPMTEVGLLFPSRFTITPRRGFANSLPPRNDVSVRADLRRIKWIRNFLQNNGSKNMSNKDVQQYLDDISGALERLGGPKYKEICAQIKDKEIGNDGDGLQNTKRFTRKISNVLRTHILQGSFKSYENRVYLIGPCKAGKTSLACILVGTDIPKTWNSINGLSIYYGQKSIHLRKREMNPLSGDDHDGIVTHGRSREFRIHMKNPAQTGSIWLNVDSQYQEPGPDELSRHLDLKPTDRQLRRFAIQFTKDDFKSLMIYLDMDYSQIEQIFDENKHLHDAMFYCLWNWKESESNPSFSDLKTALEKLNLTSGYLLKAFDVNTVVKGVPTNLLDLEPPDIFLTQLSREIGKEVFQLAIELELKVPDYEDIEYNCHHKNLPEQAYAVLRKWKQSKNSPTIKRLANAMRSINRGVNSIVKFFKEYCK